MKRFACHPLPSSTSTRTWKVLAIILLITLVVSKSDTINSGNGTTDDLELMFQIMEKDVLLLRDHVQSLLLPMNKCVSKVLEDCAMANYDACVSALPSPKCPGGGEFASESCGDGTKCGAVYDFNASVLRLAPGSYNVWDLEPSNDKVKDAVCYSLQAENYMINYTVQSRPFWKRYSVSPPPMFYGTDNGVFRIYPGNPQDCSNSFDPRLRPWYVAASTGPKDIVLVLDTSGSMGDYNRINILKEATKHVIHTLSVSDYVSVLTFSDTAQSLTSSLMQRATTDNKNSLIAQIDQLRAAGSTNFYAGLKEAFDTISQSVELTAGCQRAILFLTDGENNGSLGADELMTYIKEQIQYFANSGKRLPVFFTYSFGSAADETLPKRIACETNGIWSRINDGGSLAEAMTAYYKYFAFGLSDLQNNDFVAWVEPYSFASGQGLGTSVSAPVYDRSVDPPILAGVAALDISIAALEDALGMQGEAGMSEILQRLVDRSVAYCPRFNLSDCQYQSLRYNDQAYPPDEALCSDQCTNVSKLDVETCSSMVYPQITMNNKNLFDKSYEERACCHVGSANITMGSSDVCLDVKAAPYIPESRNTAVVATVITSSVLGFIIIVVIICSSCIQRQKSSERKIVKPTAPQLETEIPAPFNPFYDHDGRKLHVVKLDEID